MTRAVSIVNPWRIALGALTMATAMLAYAPDLSGQNSPTLDRVVESGTLRVGMSGTQPPFNARTRADSLMGFDVDLAHLLAGGLDVELQIVTKPFGELLAALGAGEVDMVVSGVSITAERTRRSAFVGPYMLSGKSLLTKSETLANAQGVADLDKPEIKLAALQNSTSQTFVEKYMPNAQLMSVSAYDEGVNMILNGQADAMVADMQICMLTVLRNPGQGLTTLTQPMTIEPIGIAVPGNDPMFLNLIENFMQAFEGSGILEQLRKKWLEDGSWIAALP